MFNHVRSNCVTHFGSDTALGVHACTCLFAGACGLGVPGSKSAQGTLDVNIPYGLRRVRL